MDKEQEIMWGSTDHNAWQIMTQARAWYCLVDRLRDALPDYLVIPKNDKEWEQHEERYNNIDDLFVTINTYLDRTYNMFREFNACERGEK